MKTTSKTYIKKIYKKRLKPQVKIAIGFISLLVFITFSFIFLNKYFKKPEYNKINYSEISDISYKVYLKPNNYFEEPYLMSGKQYITNIIDYIDINFNYSFKADTKLDYKYTYSITGIVSANEKGSLTKNLYTKKETILNNKTVKVNDNNTFFINENVKINYDKYNNLINSFKKDYILSLDSNLTLTLNINVVGTSQNNQKITFKGTNPLKVIIPLSEQTININTDYTRLNTAAVNINSVTNNNIFIYGLIGGLNVFAAILIFIYIVDIIIRLNHNKTLYSKKLDKIMKEYDKVIVMTKNIPILDDYKVIEVENFDEMLDARDTLESNILYTELIKNHKSLFLIINDDLAYVYILSDDGDGYEK